MPQAQNPFRQSALPPFSGCNLGHTCHFLSDFSVMSGSNRFSSKAAAHWGELAAKIDEIAERTGVPARDRLTLETTLAAFPWRERRRLGLILEGVRVQAVSEDLWAAVDRMLGPTSEVWASEPPRK
jgi:hypothetical protein